MRKSHNFRGRREAAGDYSSPPPNPTKGG